MSGHSKWSTIKHKKGAEDKKRGKLFTKLSRAIIVAAKEGGPDPAANASLAAAIAKARSYSMPKDNIERAVQRGAGSGEGTDAYDAITYEGYGPEGVAIIVEALTDNRNRTAADVRAIFSKHNASLGTPGSVAWQFERKGVVLVSSDQLDEDEMVLQAADAGAEDAQLDGDVWQVITDAGRPGGRAGRTRGVRHADQLRRADPGAQEHGCAGGGRCPQAAAPDRRARGQRRRAGRLRQLRHP